MDKKKWHDYNAKEDSWTFYNTPDSVLAGRLHCVAQTRKTDMSVNIITSNNRPIENLSLLVEKVERISFEVTVLATCLILCISLMVLIYQETLF